MLKLSQNNKIAISAIALFLVSFTTIIFFLEKSGRDLEGSYVNVLESNSHEETINTEDSLDPESLYRTHINDMESPLFVINAEGKITYASKDFCRLLASKCDIVLNTLFYDYINSKDLPEFASSITKIIQGENNSIQSIGPYRIIKDQEEILILLNASPIVNKDGMVSEVVFTVKDLTDQIEELNNKGTDSESPAGSGSDVEWMQELYPRIEEMKNQHEIRMMVDKISYKTNE